MLRRGREIDSEFGELPASMTDYVGRLVRMIGYRRKVRREVRRELLGHFADALTDCSSADERQAKAEQLLVEFGDPHRLAMLCRRAKKRCRPLWLKTVDAARMAIFLLVAIAGSYTAWFVSGKPVITDEYVIRMNQLGSHQLAASDNAWLEYEKALSLFVEPNEALNSVPAFKVRSLASVDDPQRRMIVAWIQANESAWAHYEAGSFKRGCHRSLEYAEGSTTMPFLMEMPPVRLLGPLRGLAEVTLWKSRIVAEEGHVDESISHCLVLARVGAHLETSATLVEQLMGMALGREARVEFLQIMARHDLAETMLTGIQNALAELYTSEVPLANFEGERLVVLDAVQHSFTRTGLGGGHMIPGQFTAFVCTVWELPQGWRTTVFRRVVLWPIDVGISMVHARRDKTIATINEVYEEIHERSQLSPYQRQQRNLGGWEEMAKSISRYRYGLVYMRLPNEGRVSEMAFRSRADHEATLAVLAIKRHRVRTRQYPADLQSLVDGGYLGRVPTDPYSDDSLIYKRVGDGFLLYSVGPDSVDDGGTPGVDDEGKPKAWPDKGDRVFWPVAESLE